MAQILAPAVAAVILLYGAWSFFLRFWQDPLRGAKNAHWSVPYTGLWIWWQHFNDRGAKAVNEAHQRDGPVVRLGPFELSINSVEGGLDTIYSFKEAMSKTDWYQLANSYGEEPMVAIKDEAPHRQRKKMLAQPYSKTSLRNNRGWVETQQRLAARFASALDDAVRPSDTTDFYDLAFAWAVDTISEYLFGPAASMKLLEDIAKARHTRESYESQRAYQFLPLPSTVLHYMGYRPEIDWIGAMQRSAGEEDSSVYQYMKQAFGTPKDQANPEPASLPEKTRAVLSSEMQDHTVAGVDTSAVVLTTFAWLLSLPPNQAWQRKLREELHATGNPTTAAELEQLSVLDAVLKEVLRLHPIVAGSQPRRTHRPVVLGPGDHQIGVPAGVTVHCQALSLHMSDVFAEPNRFDPARWLESPPEVLQEMERWYWPFGSGSRACTGAQLGQDNLKIAIATLYGGYSTELVGGTSFALTKGVIAMPVNHDGYHLRLSIRRLGDQVQ